MSKPAQLFDTINQFITDSRSLLGEGAQVELAGLDKQVKALCEQVLQLSQEDRLKYAEPLQEMLSQLSVLGEDLLAQKEAVAHEIRYLSTHKKAHAAYHSADATDGFAGDKNTKEH